MYVCILSTRDRTRKGIRSSVVAVIADRTAYCVQYTGELSNCFRSSIVRVDFSNYLTCYR